MDRAFRAVPPLSPVLLAGLPLRAVPPRLVQPLLTAAMSLVRQRHGDVFDRLSALDEPLYLIDPIDLPFVFLLRASAEAPSLTVVTAAEAAAAEPVATVRGPLVTLFDLLEGRLDGDALFFARELVVEGDAEAVVALRNAVDAAEIDVLADVLTLLGPLAGPARRVAQGATAVLSRLAQDLEAVRAALIAPALQRTDAHAARLRDLEDTVAALDRRARRGASRAR